MPLRFRKTFKIAPGIKINLSKSGLSTSIGKRGASINLGKRGTRVTTGIPGTGFSFSQLFGSKKTKEAPVGQTNQINPRPPVYQSSITPPSSKKIPLSALIGAGIIAMLCPVFFLISAITTPSTTPTPTVDFVSMQNTAIAEAWISYTQTQLALPTNTLLPTATVLPSDTPLPTFTLAPLPTATLIVFNSPTPFLLPAATAAPAQGNAVCSCSGDSLNCSDFSSHSSAQACFSYCMSVGAGDIHRLDRDGNGSACESLP